MITIKKEFQLLCPPLLPEELAQLEENLKADGCRDPLVIWGDVLIDGHNRYQICTRNNISFQTISKEFESEDAACEWIIGNQFGRRNLRSEAHALLQGQLYNLQKKKLGGCGANQHTKEQSGNSYHFAPIKTSQQIAEQTGTSEKTVRNNGKFAEAVAFLGIESDIMLGTETRTKAEIVREAFPVFASVEPILQTPAVLKGPDLAPSLAMSWAKNASLVINNISPTDRRAMEAVLYLEGKLEKLKIEIRKNN
jgi:hypothetical protein